MDFEWDENKRKATLEKHGIDFKDAAKIFRAYRLTFASDQAGESRFLTIGPLKDVFIAVVYTMRNSKLRIITARRARNGEIRAYHANDPGRGARH